MLEVNKSECRFGSGGKTPEWQPIDNGPGNALKSDSVDAMDVLLHSMSLDERAAMTASQRRIMLTKAAGAGWEKTVKEYNFDALFDKLGGTIGRTGAPDGVQVRFQCMKVMKDADGKPIKFSWTVDTTTDDSENTVPDNGAREHTGLEPVDYPDQLGGDGDTADRIGPDESEELEDTADLDESTADYTSAWPAGEIPPELDLPSEEDEDEEDEELRPFPSDLKEEWTPTPGDTLPSSAQARKQLFQTLSPSHHHHHSCTYSRVHSLTHSYLHTFPRTRARTHARTHTHTHTLTHTHSLTLTHTLSHTHARARTCSRHRWHGCCGHDWVHGRHFLHRCPAMVCRQGEGEAR
jgi:hypothetical protein